MENFSKQIIYVGSTWRYILAYVSEKFLARPISKVLLQKIIKKCSTRSLNNYPFIGWILLNVKTMPKILLYLTMSKLLLSNIRFFGIAPWLFWYPLSMHHCVSQNKDKMEEFLLFRSPWSSHRSVLVENIHLIWVLHLKFIAIYQN